jgi:2-oxoisovalerate dehydrogenase E2 component (dihydrolipoyl transacylase)
MGRYLFKLPDLGEGTAEAEIVGWAVKAGDTVGEDQPLVEVMTDKATVEITSPVSGTVLTVTGEPGEMAPVGSVLVVLEVEGAGNEKAGAATIPPSPSGEGGPRSGPGGAGATTPATSPQDAKPQPSSPIQTPPPGPSGATHPTRGREKSSPTSPASNVAVLPAFATRVAGARPLASPAVRKRARELGIELAFVPGSGPAGRIEHGDLDAFTASGGAVARSGGYAPARNPRRDAVEEVKIIGLRRKIAEKMQEAKRRIPHFMYAEEVDVTELEALRVHLNATKRPDQPRLTILPFMVRALVKILPAHPQINAIYDDEAGVLHRYSAVHCGIATQTLNGLMVPVVRHAEALDVWECANEIARVSGAAKAGKAAREELSGSTITITSLGPLGGLTHTPVINHPEVAIVGPNKMIDRPVVQHGQVVVRKMMNISSSFDHRIVDGYDAAEFIQKVRGVLEHPATLFMD